MNKIKKSKLVTMICNQFFLKSTIDMKLSSQVIISNCLTLVHELTLVQVFFNSRKIKKYNNWKTKRGLCLKRKGREEKEKKQTRFFTFQIRV